MSTVRMTAYVTPLIKQESVKRYQQLGFPSESSYINALIRADLKLEKRLHPGMEQHG